MFVSRIYEYPLVSQVCTATADRYKQAKQINTHLTALLNMVETFADKGMSTAAPVVKRFQPQLEVMDKFAVTQLEKVEHVAPFIKSDPKAALVNKKIDLEKMMSTRFQSAQMYIIDTGSVTKTRLTDKVVSLSKTPYAEAALGRFDGALKSADQMVETYLPVVKNASFEDDSSLDDETINDNRYTKLRRLCGKIRTRVPRKITSGVATCRNTSVEYLRDSQSRIRAQLAAVAERVEANVSLHDDSIALPGDSSEATTASARLRRLQRYTVALTQEAFATLPAIVPLPTHVSDAVRGAGTTQAAARAYAHVAASISWRVAQLSDVANLIALTMKLRSDSGFTDTSEMEVMHSDQTESDHSDNSAEDHGEYDTSA